MANPQLFAGAMLAVSAVFFVVGLVVAIFFLLTLQKCLTRISEPNRGMSPGQVWLLLIPLFNLFWGFYTVLKISESLIREGQTRSIDFGDGGKTMGLLYLILCLCGIIPLLGILCSLGGLVCFIMYWVKIAGYSKQLEAPAAAPAVA